MHKLYFHNKLKNSFRESKVNTNFNEYSFISMHYLENESNEEKCQFNIMTENLNNNVKVLEVDISCHMNNLEYLCLITLLWQLKYF